MSAEEAAARAACPGVGLVSEWAADKSKSQACAIGKTYGCAGGGGSGMWTKGGCKGIFQVNKAITVCEREKCAQGDMGPDAGCGFMVMTTYFTTKKDWQRNKKAKASFSKIKVLYSSLMKNGLSGTILYDELPEELLTGYACDRFMFEKVDFKDFDGRYGVNDVRYFFFQRLLQAHPEWNSGGATCLTLTTRISPPTPTITTPV